MRPFSEMVKEMLVMANLGIEGIVTRTWPAYSENASLTTKQALLDAWDAQRSSPSTR